MSVASRIDLIKSHLEDAYDAIEAKGANLHLLPSEYTQVDYIVSSGEQYIDTGVKLLNNNWEIETEIQYIEYLSSRQLLGSVSSGYYFGITSDGYYELGPSNISNVLANLNAYDKITFSNNSNIKTLNVNGVNAVSRSNSSDSSNNNYIFATGGNAKNYCKMKLKSYKLTINNELIFDFIPCYRKSDNEVGLYDLVNNVFYTNQGTGAFTYGNVHEDYAFDKNINNLSRAIALIP